MGNRKTKKEAVSGSYFLILYNQKDIKKRIGALGLIEFKKGYYVYIGSALKGRLFSRIIRHAKPSYDKIEHWHIDYFLSSPFVTIEKIILIPSSISEECNNSELVKDKAKYGIFGFGCSDCQCNSHLYYFGEKSLNW